MLRVYADVQVMQGEARALCEAIGQHDANLASQLRRNAYATALREARECMAAIDVAGRWGYVRAEDAVVDRLDKIVATLMRLTMPRT